MNVTDTIEFDDQHAIEFGKATWDETELSVRRRKNNPDGKFSPHSSSEVPIEGTANIGIMFMECVRRDMIAPELLERILFEMAQSSQRQSSLS